MPLPPPARAAFDVPPIGPLWDPVGLARRTSAHVSAPPLVRGLVRRQLQSTLSDGPPDAPVDHGLMGPASASWRLLSDPAALVAGLQALLVQTQHPIVMSAVSQNSVFRQDPLGRLRRTAAFVQATSFGDTAQALAAVDRVRAVHARITGVHLGREWRADDPDLVDWVHCSLVEALLVCDRLYAARPLNSADRDRFVAEQAQVAELLGDPDPPRTAAGLAGRMDRFAPGLAVGDDAREALAFLASPPLPAALGAVYPVVWHAAVAAMPGRHRRRLGLRRWPGALPASQLTVAALRVASGGRPAPGA